LLTPIQSLCLTLLLCGLSAGCARFEPKPISPERTAAVLENHRLDDPGLQKFLGENLPAEAKAGPRSWDLEKLVLAAFYFHPVIELARAEWDTAMAGIRTAGGRPNPTLNLTPGFNFSHVNAQPGLTPWLPFASIDLPLETAGKRAHRIARAQHLSESARLHIIATAWHVRGQVRSSLLDFIAAGRRETLLQQQVSIQEKIVASLDQQVQAGAVADTEVVTFRISLEKARLDWADAGRVRAEARAALAESIGVPVRALDDAGLPGDFPEDTVSSASLTSQEIRHEALLGRSDVLAGLADYAAAQSDLQLEIARQYPDVHLNPGYQFDQGDNIWTVGITFELPVINQNQGPIAEAKARRAETAARFNALQAKVLAEIDRAVESFHATEKALAMLGSLAADQAKSRDAIDAQVKAGAAAPLDLLNAQLEFAVAQAGQLEAQVKRQQSLAALEDAVQRPMALITSAMIERTAVAEEKKP
jgi:outer membrane protein, heavy metal efflux system